MKHVLLTSTLALGLLAACGGSTAGENDDTHSRENDGTGGKSTGGVSGAGAIRNSGAMPNSGGTGGATSAGGGSAGRATSAGGAVHSGGTTSDGGPTASGGSLSIRCPPAEGQVAPMTCPGSYTAAKEQFADLCPAPPNVGCHIEDDGCGLSVARRIFNIGATFCYYDASNGALVGIRVTGKVSVCVSFDPIFPPEGYWDGECGSGGS